MRQHSSTGRYACSSGRPVNETAPFDIRPRALQPLDHEGHVLITPFSSSPDRKSHPQKDSVQLTIICMKARLPSTGAACR